MPHCIAEAPALGHCYHNCGCYHYLTWDFAQLGCEACPTSAAEAETMPHCYTVATTTDGGEDKPPGMDDGEETEEQEEEEEEDISH